MLVLSRTTARRSAALAALTIAAFVYSSPARACYTGLTLIPTAAVLDERTYAVDLQWDMPVPHGGSHTRILNTQFAIADGLEAGVDFDLSDGADDRLWFNAKWQLAEAAGDRPAVAIGLTSLTTGTGGDPYVVASFSGERGNLHTGLLRSAGDTSVFAGVDYPISERVSLMADHTSGPGNYSALALCRSLSSEAERYLILGLELPNSSGDDTLLTVQYYLVDGF